MIMPFNDCYKDRTVLITGHAGFKGSWLALWLKHLGARVVGYSLLPHSEKRLYEVINLHSLIDDDLIADINNSVALNSFFNKHHPDIVFHLAAQPLVLLSYICPIDTYETNVIGTLKVLEAARFTPSVKAFVNVTTDKCYENMEKDEGYIEDDPLGGFDMYSSSKGCSEILSAAYRRSYLNSHNPTTPNSHTFCLATARAGNVIGGGDWAKNRLIPDCIKSILQKKNVHIRKPLATRPWQFVLEPLAGYLRLGQKMLEDGNFYAQSYNFGPDPHSVLNVATVAQSVAKLWGCNNSQIVLNQSDPALHEATLLQLNSEKAARQLDIKPVYTATTAISQTVQWYKDFYSGSCDMATYCLKQIDEFTACARNKGLKWSL